MYLACFYILLIFSCSQQKSEIENISFGSGNFGKWIYDEYGLPAYEYTANCEIDSNCLWEYYEPGSNKLTESKKHWYIFGNGRIVVLGFNSGAVTLLTQDNGYIALNWYRYRFSPELLAGGISAVRGKDFYFRDYSFSSDFRKIFGTGYFRKYSEKNGVSIDHIIFPPIWDKPYILSMSTVNNPTEEKITFEEYWEGNAFIFFPFADENYRIEKTSAYFDSSSIQQKTVSFKYRTPVPEIFLRTIGEDEVKFELKGKSVKAFIEIAPKSQKTLCFAYGYSSVISDIISDCKSEFIKTIEFWKTKLPEFKVSPSWISREIAWDYFSLRSSFPLDLRSGKHHGNAFNSYQYVTGGLGFGYEGSSGSSKFPKPSRDESQYVVALSLYDPQLAREILEYTLMQVPRDINITWWHIENLIVPSDFPIYLLWAVAEYVLSTRDFSFLYKELPYFDGATGSVWEHCKVAYNYLLKRVGFGPSGMIKIFDGDWNDAIVTALYTKEGADREKIRESAESVLNSAMAVYVFPYLANLSIIMGDFDFARELNDRKEKICSALEKEFNGKWYSRIHLYETKSYVQGDIIGWDRMYLEPQPWLVISGCADKHRTEKVLEYIWKEFVSPSPLAAPILIKPVEHDVGGNPGEGHDGGIWPLLNGHLIWAYSLYNGEKAWEIFKKNTLAYHGDVYPDIWIGIWGGFDSWNSWFSEKPGWTWEQVPLWDMNIAPVGHPDPHFSQLGALVKLLGIEFHYDKIKIKPSIPAPFSFKTKIFGLEVSEGSIKGYYYPLSEDKFNFEIFNTKRLKRLLVNSLQTENYIKSDNWIIFEFSGGNFDLEF